MTWKLEDQYSVLNRLPGQCSNCGLPRRKRPLNPSGYEQVLLTGIVIDFEGNVEFCETCIREVAEMLGFVTPEKHEEVMQEAATLKVANDKLTSEVSEQADSIRVLTNELNRALGDTVAA